MTVTDGLGLPMGLHLAAANHHEVTLAEATLRTIKGPQKRGRPRTRPQELVDTAAESADQGGTKLLVPLECYTLLGLDGQRSLLSGVLCLLSFHLSLVLFAGAYALVYRLYFKIGSI